ncbi:PGPGW domain-containing protein [Phyllobacterium phragmitis]|nr:PGPGW domain-containing protein [Phyllobacterium phragmitis]
MRRILGIVLVIGGILGFLPVLGFWMVPLGLLVLSHDSAIIRRWRRKLEVRFGRKRQKK